MRMAAIEGAAAGYMIREDGVVFHPLGYELSLTPTSKGYRQATIRDPNGRAFCHKVHRLVAFAFIPNPLNYPHVLHKNDNRADNHVSNLMWGNDMINQQLRRNKERDQLCLILDA